MVDKYATTTKIFKRLQQLLKQDNKSPLLEQLVVQMHLNTLS